MDLLNRVMVVGNLTRDPEVRETGNGKKVAQLSLALDPPGGGGGESGNEPGRDRDRNRPPSGAGNSSSGETIFLDVVVWERMAENAGQYLKKGSSVLIEGRLRMDSWQDKETGKTRRKLKVAGERMRFLNLGGSGEGGARDSTGARHHESAGSR